eukprot:scaffold4057_cov208-Skeletonema_dohrnii-CCMP3373.AAC.2
MDAPTLITLRSRLAASTCVVFVRRKNRLANLRPPHVQIIDMVEKTIPTPGSINLGATFVMPIGPIKDASITLRAKMNVTALITVKIT